MDDWVIRRARGVDFWRKLESAFTPLVASDPLGAAIHALVTFLWRGSGTTQPVLVYLISLADPRDRADNLIDRVRGKDLWHCSVRMRRESDATCMLCVDECDVHGAYDEPCWPSLRSERRLTRLIRHTLASRLSGRAGSWVALSNASLGENFRDLFGLFRRRLCVHSLQSGRLAISRRVCRFAASPVGETGGDLHVMVLLDGALCHPGFGVATLLDSLIADSRLALLVTLVRQSLGDFLSWSYMTCDPRFDGLLAHSVLAWSGAHLPLSTELAGPLLAAERLGGLAAE
ncbi:enterochelin esterase domain-containing protein [Streptomyces rimosus]|uniref:enterochelin esterase domain-containing protein n=1 Tax=Streptomyces rimosus TaxID=1927 RepID=UPI00312008DA